MVALAQQTYTRAASVSDVKAAGCLAVQVDGHTLALFAYGDNIYAVDNRCPHMGFPLDRGTVRDGVLTCHWHHARFDLASGGTFDQFADDMRVFPTRLQDGEVWVDLSPRGDPRLRQRDRLSVGLERDLPLVIGKAVIALLDGDGDAVDPFRIGLEFGSRYRQGGWGQGLTMHTCFVRLLPHLDDEDRPRALYHGLSAVALDCDGMPPRFPIRPLPSASADADTFKRWFRRFVEVRDAEGAERCIVSAVRAGVDRRQIADMLFAAATDHRYVQIGHVVDFTNKALEALDLTGWSPALAESVLASLASGFADADRMEESNAWRNPADLIEILERAFEQLPAALEAGRNRRDRVRPLAREAWAPVLLGEDAQVSLDALLEALREGHGGEELAGAVAYAAALRIAQFHTSNEFSDWDTALHTFTFANAVHQGMQRAPSIDLLRGVFDAAMSVYLDRFLNVPAARLPEPDGNGVSPDAILDDLHAALDRQQQVNLAGEYVARYLHLKGDPARLLAMLGRLLLREDRNFHTVQTLEAAFSQYALLRGTSAGAHVLVAAARYLAAHAPTVRAQGQTYQIAQRLHRGEHLFEESA